MLKRRSLSANTTMRCSAGSDYSATSGPRHAVTGYRRTGDEFLTHNQLCRSHSTSVQPAPSSAARPEDPSRMSAGPGRAGSTTTMWTGWEVRSECAT